MSARAAGRRPLAQDQQPTRDLTVVARAMAGFGGGFRQEWISGESDDVEVSLASGAGLGSPYLTLQVTIGDETRYEVVDMRPVLQSWAKAIEDEIRAGDSSHTEQFEEVASDG